MKPLVRYHTNRLGGKFVNTCELAQWPTVRKTLGNAILFAVLIGDLA